MLVHSLDTLQRILSFENFVLTLQGDQGFIEAFSKRHSGKIQAKVVISYDTGFGRQFAKNYWRP